MKKQLLYITILLMFVVNMAKAEDSVEISPVLIDEIPAVQMGEYKTQYPLPVNSYQTQGYNNEDQLKDYLEMKK